MKKVGMRIDVDTFYGTCNGVPRLLELLDLYNIRASIFFSVGPDNMGRHLWRLIKPVFLKKILRSRAFSLYGWNILLAGTAWPGKLIGIKNKEIIRSAATQHEIGLHAWDHYSWQLWCGVWKISRLIKEINRGLIALSSILNHPILCSASAGWKADQRVILAKEQFDFYYNSDCRGISPFRPLLDKNKLGTVQIPVSLPTWDEIINLKVTENEYNQYIIHCIHNNKNVPIYTIHAEVEGIACYQNFEKLLKIAKEEGIKFCSLKEMLPNDLNTLPINKIIRKKISGREGWVGFQCLKNYI